MYDYHLNTMQEMTRSWLFASLPRNKAQDVHTFRIDVECWPKHWAGLGKERVKSDFKVFMPWWESTQGGFFFRKKPLESINSSLTVTLKSL
jgi:hypothetical protein